MENIRILYLCSAVDEETKSARHIQFNNAAATNKVFGIAKALQNQNADIHIVSLGRGKQLGSKERFPALHKTISGISVHYAVFWHIPILTHLVGALSLASLVRQLSRGYRGKVILIAYNRLWHYLPSLVQARVFGVKSYIDLEDGNIPSTSFFGQKMGQIRNSLFDHYCQDGALLAAKALNDQVKTKNTFVCYGCTEIQKVNENKWTRHPIQVLFGGSLLKETGVQLLMDTIRLLESQNPELKKQLKFIITGYGSKSDEFSRFSTADGAGWINFLGDIDRKTYLSVLSESHIGLCLKLGSSEMGKTTFPSKILEYASYGLAIITTKVSDVPDLLDDKCAIFLDQETPQLLVDIFNDIVEKSLDLQAIGKNGQEKINSRCSTESVGKNLKKFLLREPN